MFDWRRKLNSMLVCNTAEKVEKAHRRVREHVDVKVLLVVCHNFLELKLNEYDLKL